MKNGATIISGLAFGCDSITHQQALDSNDITVAILPSPLNNILPARNKGLAFQIALTKTIEMESDIVWRKGRIVVIEHFSYLFSLVLVVRAVLLIARLRQGLNR